MSAQRYGLITDEASQQVDVAMELAQRHGCSFVDVRSMRGRPPLSLTADDCAKARRAAARLDLGIHTFCSPALKSPIPRDKRAIRKERDRFLKSVEVASELGAHRVRIFSFTQEDHEVIGLDQVAAALMTVLGDFADLPVALALENGTTSCTPTLRSMQALRMQLDVPLDLIWDPGSEFRSGESAGAKLLRSAERLDHVVQIQIKNPSRDLQNYAPLPTGAINWPQLLARLRTSFAGEYSLETHHRAKPIPADLELRPWGFEFSDGGYEATSEALKVLEGWLSERCHSGLDGSGGGSMSEEAN